MIQVLIDDTLIDRTQLERLVATAAASRLFTADPTLWGAAAEDEAEKRLGWVFTDPIERYLSEATAHLRALSSDSRVSQIILCGMGGSSLAPQVICASQGVEILAVDSTHPVDIDAYLSEEELERSVVVVSSKSGGTVETTSSLALCEARFAALGLDPRERLLLISDPGSHFEQIAHERGYRLHLGDPDIGGRYSALSPFGLTPSVLAGADASDYASQASETRELCAVDGEENPALRTAVALWTLAQRSVCLDFSGDAPFQLLPDWIEQLVAESTGKEGMGLLPIPTSGRDGANTTGVVLSEQLIPDSNADIVVVGPLAAQFLFWEAVTALLCVLLDVNPFDQPDVESTKVETRRLLAEQQSAARSTEDSPTALTSSDLVLLEDTGVDESVEQALERFARAAGDASYLAIQAFCPYSDPEIRSALLMLQRDLRERLSIPVALGYGPKYLHSTGQLHKGGPRSGVYLQLLALADHDIEIPQAGMTFGQLNRAAALGDAAVLRTLQRPVLTLGVRSADAVERVGASLRS